MELIKVSRKKALSYFLMFFIVVSLFVFGKIESNAATVVDANFNDTVSVKNYSSKKASKLKVKSSNKKVKAYVQTYKVKGVTYYSVNTAMIDSYSEGTGTEKAVITVSFYDKAKKKTVTEKKTVIFHDGYQYYREHFIVLGINQKLSLTPMKRSVGVKWTDVNRNAAEFQSELFKLSKNSSNHSYKITANKKGEQSLFIRTGYMNGEIINENYTILVTDSKKQANTHKVIEGQTSHLYYELPLTGKVTLTSKDKDIVTTQVQQTTGRKFFKKEWSYFNYESGYLSDENQSMVLLLFTGEKVGKTSVTMTYKNSKTKKEYEITIPIEVLGKEKQKNNQTIQIVDSITDEVYSSYLLDSAGNKLKQSPFISLIYDGDDVNYNGSVLSDGNPSRYFTVRGGLGRDFLLTIRTKDLNGNEILSYEKNLSYKRGKIEESSKHKFKTNKEAIDFFCGKKEVIWNCTREHLRFVREGSIIKVGVPSGNPWDFASLHADIDTFNFEFDAKEQTITLTAEDHTVIVDYYILNENKVLISVNDRDYILIRE